MIELDLKELADLLVIRTNEFRVEVIKLTSGHGGSHGDCQYALGDIESVIEELKRKVK